MLLLIFQSDATIGTADGTSTAAAVGQPLATGTAAADGVATVAGVGQPIAAAVGAAAGVATADGVGGQVNGGSGSADGVATAMGDGEALGVPHQVIGHRTGITQTGIALTRTTRLAA